MKLKYIESVNAHQGGLITASDPAFRVELIPEHSNKQERCLHIMLVKGHMGQQPFIAHYASSRTSELTITDVKEDINKVLKDLEQRYSFRPPD